MTKKKEKQKVENFEEKSKVFFRSLKDWGKRNCDKVKPNFIRGLTKTYFLTLLSLYKLGCGKCQFSILSIAICVLW